MTYNNILASVTVRINSKDEETGSGIIYKPAGSDFVYIFTAKHCIYGKDFDNRAKRKDVKIDKIKVANQTKEYILQKGDRIILDDIDDIVAIVINGKRFPGFDDIPQIKLAGLNIDRTNVWFKGYPSLTYTENLKSVQGFLHVSDMDGAKFQVETERAFLKYYNKSKAQGLCKGFSGSGICGQVGELPYLQGVISRFDKAIGFECIALSSFIEKKLPDLQLLDIGVENYLSDGHFSSGLERALKELKPRYQEMNFALPIEDYFQQLDAQENYREKVIANINKLLQPIKNFSININLPENDFLKFYADIKLDTKASGNKTFQETHQDLLAKAAVSCQSVNYVINDFENVEHWNLARDSFNQLLKLVSDFALALQIRIDIDARKKEKKHEVTSIRSYHKAISGFTRDLDALYKFLVSKIFIGKKYMLIKGEAGNGKSQLLGFMAKKRMNENALSILILGQSLNGEQNIWGQICQYFCNQQINELKFLDLLEKKGRMVGRPVIVFIDAINEGKGIRLWNREFNDFIAILDRYKFIKVVLSYRNSYERALFKNIEIDQSHVLEHMGFRGVEREAVKFFFEDAKMSVPIIPFYSMQFSNPLFLRLFTLLYKSRRGRLDVNSWVGTITVYNHFFEHINDLLGHEDQFKYESYKLDIVNLAIKKFVKKQWKKQSLYLRYRTAFKLVEKAVQYYTSKNGFFAALISHGLFYENRYFIGRDEDELGVDFAYQKLGEYIKIQFLIRSLSWDVASSAVKPDGKLFFLHKDFDLEEQYAGLIEATAIMVPFYFDKEIFELSPDLIEKESVIQAFISSLKDRSPASITEKTRNYLREILNNNPQMVSLFWTNVLEFSFQPANALNIDFIHTYLSGLTLAQRDASWTVFINNNYEERGSGVLIMIRWALDYKNKGIIDQYSIKAIAKTLFWFFGSTNRELRDYASKAAIFLFTENISLLKSVMIDFENVNDPYITQRIYAVAFGATVRNKNSQALAELATYIIRQVFIDQRVGPDILVRDYARLTFEYCRYLGIEFPFFEGVMRSNKSAILPDAPTDEQINKYSNELSTNKKGYTGIDYILNSMVTEHSSRGNMYGDFGRYTFGAAVSHWKDYPDNLLSNLAIKMIVEELGYNQVLSDIDSNPDYVGRNPPKVERIGKKYQWIVFYQILARLADNYDYYERYYSDEKAEFSGAWAPFVRDFEPTTALRESRTLPKSASWLNYSYELPKKAMASWLQDTEDFPDFRKLIEVKDERNVDWLVLQFSRTWRDGDRDLWYQLRSYLMPKKQKNKITNWLMQQNFRGRWMPESQTRTELYLREYFWSPATSDLTQPYYGGREWHELRGENGGIKIGEIAVTCLEYLWERDAIDQDNGSTNLLLPNKILFDLLKLKHGDIDGQFVNESGEVIAFDPSAIYNVSSRLLVRKNELLAALRKNNLEIFWTGLGEKLNMSRDDGKNDGQRRHLEISSVAFYNNKKLSVSFLTE